MLGAEVVQHLADQADALILLHAGLQELVELFVRGIDHRCGLRQQSNLVDRLDAPRFEEHLLAIDDRNAHVLQREQHRRFDDVDTDRLTDEPVVGQYVVHLLRNIVRTTGVR
jgi:hypothetical protein